MILLLFQNLYKTYHSGVILLLKHTQYTSYTQHYTSKILSNSKKPFNNTQSKLLIVTRFALLNIFDNI